MLAGVAKAFIHPGTNSISFNLTTMDVGLGGGRSVLHIAVPYGWMWVCEVSLSNTNGVVAIAFVLASVLMCDSFLPRRFLQGAKIELKGSILKFPVCLCGVKQLKHVSGPPWIWSVSFGENELKARTSGRARMRSLGSTERLHLRLHACLIYPFLWLEFFFAEFMPVQFSIDFRLAPQRTGDETPNT